jgi:heptosyltransferase II
MKVMIRVPNWVGDAVMAEPALRHLRQVFKDAHITFVARPWVAGLFEGENLHDELIPVTDAKGFQQSLQKFFKETRLLKRQAFDYAVLLTNSFGTAFTARVAGIPKIAGYATDWRGALLHKAIPFEKDYKAKHQIFYYLTIALEIERDLQKDVQVDLQSPQPQLHATAESLNRARELFAEAGIIISERTGCRSIEKSEVNQPLSLTGSQQLAIGSTAPDPYVQIRNPQSAIRNRLVALNPGATNSRAKQWLRERFAATADTLAERDGFQTVIVGAAGDVEVANEVAQLMRTPVANLAGQTTIAELKAVLALSSLVLSNDTGAAHVSAALGVPTVVIFGPTEHFATHPLADLSAVVRQDVDCSPCMLKDCPIDHRCMTRVEVPDVYVTAKKLLVQAGI